MTLRLEPPTPAVRSLLAGPKFGTGIGFRRMQLLLASLLDSDWGARFTTIRVTGSNGKGSVSAMTHGILRALGVDCGRYTSPHLYRFHERIVLRDAEISDDLLDDSFAWVEAERARLAGALGPEEFGSFELATALCIRSFFVSGIAVGVVEAGIGGRYDTTRVLPGDLVALTSVDLEHAEILGRTLELIAYDKLDLCPDGGTVVVLRRDDDLGRRIAAYARLRRLTLVDAAGACRAECLGVDLAGARPGMRVRIRTAAIDCEAVLPLIGTHQLENLAVAVTLVETWASRHLPQLAPAALESAVVRGLHAVDWPGRFQRIATEPLCLIDVGHSPDACARLVESVRQALPGCRILLVTGVSSNKAVSEILGLLVPIAHKVICTRAYHMGEAVGRISDEVRQLAPGKEVVEAPTIELAAAQARALALAEDLVIVVAGGLFLSIEFHVAWEGQDPRTLKFL